MFFTRFGTLNQHYCLSKFLHKPRESHFAIPLTDPQNSTSGIANLLCNLRIMLKKTILEKTTKGKCFHAETTKAGDYNDAAINLCYYGMS